MKSLLLSSSVVVVSFLFSCSSVKQVSGIEKDNAETTLHTYFNSSATSAKYKAEISIFGKHFSGILFFKFTNDTTCRSAFVTVPGMKLFDLQLTPQACQVNECIPQLNKKGVLATIEKNIRIFTMLDNYIGENVDILPSHDQSLLVRRFTIHGAYNFYQYQDDRIFKIEYLNKAFKKKIILTAQDFQGSLPGIVNIKNRGINLSIHLIKL